MRPTSPETPRRFSSLGCGCGITIAGVLAVLVGLAWYAYIQGERFEETLRDPAARAQRSREILGYDELPPGYHPMGGFSIPFVMKMAMLSDRDLAPGEGVEGAADAFRERGFVLMISRARESQREELGRYFAGQRSETEFFDQTDLTFEREESLGRGTVEVAPATIHYLVERGRMDLGGRVRHALLARLLIGCPGDGRLRTGLWFEPVREDGGDAALAGSPADPEALRTFLAHFALCPDRGGTR